MSINCQAISKRFGATQALDQVTLTLEPGHIYGLLGNNGAGKSTLLSILTDRQLPDTGTVTIDGLPARNNDKALHKVFLVGDQNFFPDDMKVQRALRTVPYFYPDFDLARAFDLAKQFGLPLKKKLPNLSTGYASIFRLIVGLCVNTLPHLRRACLGLGRPAPGAVLPAAGGDLYVPPLHRRPLHPPD